MARIDQQITFADIDPDYQAFVDKFKPKKTTDDCYTPDNIYKVVLDWVVKEYGIDPDKVVRPFWSGGDYMSEDYPEGCTVVDNPPFSICTKITRDYNAAGIKFFLFCPYLTCFQASAKENDVTFIITSESITYENGAEVGTAFVTNLDSEYRARAVPELARAIKEANKINLRKIKKEMPKYKFPDEICTAAMLGYMAAHDTALNIRKEDAYFYKVLDAMRAQKKSGIFGGAFLLSEKAAAEKAAAEKTAAEKTAAEKAAAEKAAAEKWQKEIVRSLGK